MTDTTDDTETRMTRRDALRGGSAAAVAAGSFLLQQQLVQRAAAQTNEPRINLGDNYAIDDDPGGNGDLVITDLSNSTEVLRYDRSASQWTVTDVAAGQASVTDDTNIKATRTSQSAEFSSIGRANLFDGASSDPTNEFNANNRFVPAETAEYHADFLVAFDDPATPGDLCYVDVREDPDGSDNLIGRFTLTIDEIGRTKAMQMPPIEYTAGTAYQFEGLDRDSSFSIDTATEGHIYKKTNQT